MAAPRATVSQLACSWQFMGLGIYRSLGALENNETVSKRHISTSFDGPPLSVQNEQALEPIFKLLLGRGYS